MQYLKLAIVFTLTSLSLCGLPRRIAELEPNIPEGITNPTYSNVDATFIIDLNRCSFNGSKERECKVSVGDDGYLRFEINRIYGHEVHHLFKIPDDYFGYEIAVPFALITNFVNGNPWTITTKYGSTSLSIRIWVNYDSFYNPSNNINGVYYRISQQPQYDRAILKLATDHLNNSVGRAVTDREAVNRGRESYSSNIDTIEENNANIERITAELNQKENQLNSISQARDNVEETIGDLQASMDLQQRGLNKCTEERTALDDKKDLLTRYTEETSIERETEVFNKTNKKQCSFHNASLELSSVLSDERLNIFSLTKEVLKLKNYKDAEKFFDRPHFYDTQ